MLENDGSNGARAEDVFANEAHVRADLDLLENMRWAAKEFENRICAASMCQEPATISVLRLSPTYQFAEFFYLLRAQCIEDTEQVRALAELHNDYLARITRDRPKMQRLGLRDDRLLDAIFTADTMPRLLQQWRDEPGAIDQSNLARFLVTTMSSETCRKLIVASTEAGFLTRTRSAYGTVVVRSTGVMEQVFGRCLREMRERVTREQR